MKLLLIIKTLCLLATDRPACVDYSVPCYLKHREITTEPPKEIAALCVGTYLEKEKER